MGMITQVWKQTPVLNQQLPVRQWKHKERVRDASNGFNFEDEIYQEMWADILKLTPVQNGRSTQCPSLEPVHVFLMAHILRRPIVVFGGEFVLDVDAPNQYNKITFPECTCL
eukprot:scpid60639/ scgid31139/ Ubiquitin thioesterase trabid